MFSLCVFYHKITINRNFTCDINLKTIFFHLLSLHFFFLKNKILKTLLRFHEKFDTLLVFYGTKCNTDIT